MRGEACTEADDWLRPPRRQRRGKHFKFVHGNTQKFKNLNTNQVRAERHRRPASETAVSVSNSVNHSTCDQPPAALAQRRSSLLILQATAVMRAAPLPLPSSDWRKVTWHWGARSCSVSCMILEKLHRGDKKRPSQRWPLARSANTISTLFKEIMIMFFVFFKRWALCFQQQTGLKICHVFRPFQAHSTFWAVLCSSFSWSPNFIFHELMIFFYFFFNELMMAIQPADLEQ